MQENVKVQQSFPIFRSQGSELSNELSHFVNADFELRIIQAEIYRQLSHLMIYDESNNILYNSKDLQQSDFVRTEERGVMILRLPSGNYTIRLKIDGQFTNTAIRLDRNKTCVIGEIENYLRSHMVDQYIELPKLFSSVPLDGSVGYASTFDYYVYAAKEISAINTLAVDNFPNNSGLFIFFRYPNADIFQKKCKGKTYWSKFTLYDSRNRIVARFPVGTSESRFSNLENGAELGYLGFSAQLPQGLYFIKYRGKDSRTIPVYVYPNWYTQVFMMVEKEPLFGTLKVLLDKNKRFDSKNILHSYVDICLSKLQNGDYTIDDELMEMIAYGKYKSPMLGLLGAFIYLKGNQQGYDERFKLIVDNLQDKILSDSSNSQDIYALNFLKYQRFGTTLYQDVKKNTNGTPMFRVAYDAIREAASIHRWVIPMNSLNDRVAENQCFDSPFNTYKTIKYQRFKVAGKTDKKQVGISENLKNSIEAFMDRYSIWDNYKSNYPIQILLDSGDREELTMETIKLKASLKREPTPLPDMVNETNLVNYTSYDDRLRELLKSPDTIGRIGVQVAQMLLDHGAASERLIAEKLNLPISTIKRIRDKFKI